MSLPLPQARRPLSLAFPAPKPVAHPRLLIRPSSAGSLVFLSLPRSLAAAGGSGVARRREIQDVDRQVICWVGAGVKAGSMRRLGVGWTKKRQWQVPPNRVESRRSAFALFSLSDVSVLTISTTDARFDATQVRPGLGAVIGSVAPPSRPLPRALRQLPSSPERSRCNPSSSKCPHWDPSSYKRASEHDSAAQ